MVLTHDGGHAFRLLARIAAAGFRDHAIFRHAVAHQVIATDATLAELRIFTREHLPRPLPEPRQMIIEDRVCTRRQLAFGHERAQAVRLAMAALHSGLTNVGVLDSSRYSSLHPGYYVVFSGIFKSQAAAQGTLSNAQSSGYPSAYARPITP